MCTYLLFQITTQAGRKTLIIMINRCVGPLHNIILREKYQKLHHWWIIFLNQIQIMQHINTKKNTFRQCAAWSGTVELQVLLNLLKLHSRFTKMKFGNVKIKRISAFQARCTEICVHSPEDSSKNFTVLNLINNESSVSYTIYFSPFNWIIKLNPHSV